MDSVLQPAAGFWRGLVSPYFASRTVTFSPCFPSDHSLWVSHVFSVSRVNRAWNQKEAHLLTTVSGTHRVRHFQHIQALCMWGEESGVDKHSDLFLANNLWFTCYLQKKLSKRESPSPEGFTYQWVPKCLIQTAPAIKMVIVYSLLPDCLSWEMVWERMSSAVYLTTLVFSTVAWECKVSFHFMKRENSWGPSVTTLSCLFI